MISVRSILVVALPFLIGSGSAGPVEKRAIYSGTPIGFASGATGGGSAATVYPTTIAELTAYLTSDAPQNIVISGTFDFTGSEGTTTVAACDAYACTPSNGGQALLNTLGGCGTKATYNVNVDTAAYQALWIKSNKSLVGKNGATIKGKGFRLSGVENIIIQNIKITELNPKYVWGGDAIALTGCKNIWIDHVTVSTQILSVSPSPSRLRYLLDHELIPRPSISDIQSWSPALQFRHRG